MRTMKLDSAILESVNRPGRVGVLATADKAGHPNVAYFGSPRLNPDGTLVMGLTVNRTLHNLEENPWAALFTAESAPVTFSTPGWRLYLTVRELQKAGPKLDAVRQEIAARAGEATAQKIKACVVFEVTEIRSLVDLG
jgi:predicted pyridoxine 5'-phosphate oxidase superfamily flavin-nucleotide-binding protein